MHLWYLCFYSPDLIMNTLLLCLFLQLYLMHFWYVCFYSYFVRLHYLRAVSNVFLQWLQDQKTTNNKVLISHYVFVAIIYTFVMAKLQMLIINLCKIYSKPSLFFFYSCCHTLCNCWQVCTGPLLCGACHEESVMAQNQNTNRGFVSVVFYTICCHWIHHFCTL